MAFLFNVDKAENGYILVLASGNEPTVDYVFTSKAKLVKAIKEVLAMDNQEEKK